MRMASRLRVVAAPLIVLALGASGGCSSCKKKTNEDLTKDEGKKKHAPSDVPMPPDLAFELVIKDPDGAAKRGADASGYGAAVGSSPYEAALALVPDPDAQKILRAIDPHGAVALVVTAKAQDLLDVDHWSKDSVQVVVAAHLKDRELAMTALDAQAKSKGKPSGPAKGFDGKTYELDSDTAVGVSGDLVLVGDGAASLEKCARYALFLAQKGDDQPHDVTMRVPLDALEAQVVKTIPSAWAKARPDAPPAIAANPPLAMCDV